MNMEYENKFLGFMNNLDKQTAVFEESGDNTAYLKVSVKTTYAERPATLLYMSATADLFGIPREYTFAGVWSEEKLYTQYTRFFEMMPGLAKEYPSIDDCLRSMADEHLQELLDDMEDDIAQSRLEGYPEISDADAKVVREWAVSTYITGEKHNFINGDMLSDYTEAWMKTCTIPDQDLVADTELLCFSKMNEYIANKKDFLRKLLIKQDMYEHDLVSIQLDPTEDEKAARIMATEIPRDARKVSAIINIDGVRIEMRIPAELFWRGVTDYPIEDLYPIENRKLITRAYNRRIKSKRKVFATDIEKLTYYHQVLYKKGEIQNEHD